MLSSKRITNVVVFVVVVIVLVVLFQASVPSAREYLDTSALLNPKPADATAKNEPDAPPKDDQKVTVVEEETLPNAPKVPISYDKTTPPSTGCEDIVAHAQHYLIQTYQQLLKGIRYANIWGYLETENKGDAAIWSAQQILLSMMGIDFMEACRFLDKEKGCDVDRFKAALAAHPEHSAIIIAGGGNFNDFYWEDQPSRMNMVKNFPDVAIRSFPQSVYMTHEDRINATQEIYGNHHNLQLAARDQPSFDFLDKTFQKPFGVQSVLTPDIAFMWGNRPDFREKTEKTHDVLILGRDDWEISAGDSQSIASGEGLLDLGGSVGNVTYRKVDWKFTDTPGINAPKDTDPNSEQFRAQYEPGKNQRAWAKAIAGFEMLGSARFVITDRLHGHIMSTLIGTPHVLMDSKLGKNKNYHDTWTKDCECTRLADDITEAKNFARMFFEKERAKGVAEGEKVGN